VPAERGGPELGRLIGEDQQGEFESLGEADVLEFSGGGSGAQEVAVVERSSEGVRKPSRSRSCERMFAPFAVGMKNLRGETCLVRSSAGRNL
jgi:hypothetical protein